MSTVAKIVVVVIAMAISTASIHQDKGVNRRASTNESLKCHCTEHSAYFFKNGTNVTILCDKGQGFCDIPANLPDGACAIATAVSGRPFDVRKACSQLIAVTNARRANEAVIVSLIANRSIVVAAKCNRTFCNANYTTAGHSWVDRELVEAADQCVPVMPIRTKRLLEVRRNLSNLYDTLNCDCTASGQLLSYPCNDGYCSTAGMSEADAKNDEVRGTMCTWKPTATMCENVDESIERALPNAAAAFVIDKKVKGLDFYGCVHADYCNADVTVGDDGHPSLEDAICHWTCPKLKATKIKWWQWMASSLVLSFVCAVVVLIASTRCRLSIRLAH